MKNKIIAEVKEKWAEIANYTQVHEFKVDIDLYKKMLDIVHIGPCYYFIFTPGSGKINFISNEMPDILGYKIDDFSIEKLLSIIHPQDFEHFIEFENAVVDFKLQLPAEKKMKYKSRYNYRVRTATGEYINLIQQSVTIALNEDGSVLHNLIFHTDITHLSPSTEMKLSFIGLEGEPSYLKVDPVKLYDKLPSIFTVREQEILNYMIKGYNSEKISSIINRSIHTIRVHRKNILSKSGCATVNELIATAIKEGWVD